MILTPDRQRERLKGLTLVRVILVTAFLGSAVALDVSTFADLSEPRNATLVGLIVVTYLLTIGYAIGLKRQMSTATLAHFQLAGDLFIATLLTLVTGGFDSLFLFIYHLTIINAAIVAGHRAALVVAGITAGCMVYFASLTLGWLPHPIFDTEILQVSTTGVAYEVLVNSLAGFLIALLAGQLTQRLGRANQQLERHKTDIAELRALNKNILSSISSGLLTVDQNGIIIFFNRAAEDITGLDSDQVLGRPLERLFPGLATAAAEHDSDDPDPRLESTFERDDGTRLYLGFSLSPLKNRTGEKIGQIIIFQDLSDIKKLEERMKRSERLAAVGELSAAIAHEIRNPLASISGSVEMLETDLDDSDDDRLLMDIIVREVDRLDHLIGDFLGYSQPRNLERDHHRISPIIGEVTRLFRAHADRQNIALDITDPPDEQPVIDIDAESFRQILWNLLQNASDVIEELPEERRRIRIETKVRQGDAPTVTVAVEDDGTGIDDDSRERLFEPFFTTKEDGTGLGLATTYRLLEQQEGHIETTEPKNLRGARFEVTLPIVESQEKKKNLHRQGAKNAKEETVGSA